jgi:hypothetical protein
MTVEYDPFKSDVYSCGKIFSKILSITNLKKENSLYIELNAIISKMLEIDILKRISLEKANERLIILDQK